MGSYCCYLTLISLKDLSKSVLLVSWLHWWTQGSLSLLFLIQYNFIISVNSHLTYKSNLYSRDGLQQGLYYREVDYLRIVPIEFTCSKPLCSLPWQHICWESQKILTVPFLICNKCYINRFVCKNAEKGDSRWVNTHMEWCEGESGRHRCLQVSHCIDIDQQV